MAKNGFKVFDSDMHIDGATRSLGALHRAGVSPRRSTRQNIRECPRPGLDLSERFSRRACAPAALPHKGHNYERTKASTAITRRAAGPAKSNSRRWTPKALTLPCYFPRGDWACLPIPISHPRFAAALARAYNDWLHDFCRSDPSRLLGAGMISIYDIDDAVEETRRVAEEYGFRSVFLRSNLVNGKNWYNPYYEPLWNTLEELNLPSVFTKLLRPARVKPRNISSPTSVSGASTRSRFEQMMGMGAFLRRRHS